MPIKTDPTRWLRNIKDGTIYAYSEYLAGNPSVTEVSEEQAFPERFVPAKQRGRKTTVNLDGADAPVEPAVTNAALAEEVTKDLAKATRKGKK